MRGVMVKGIENSPSLVDGNKKIAECGKNGEMLKVKI